MLPRSKLFTTEKAKLIGTNRKSDSFGSAKNLRTVALDELLLAIRVRLFPGWFGLGRFCAGSLWLRGFWLRSFWWPGLLNARGLLRGFDKQHLKIGYRLGQDPAFVRIQVAFSLFLN